MKKLIYFVLVIIASGSIYAQKSSEVLQSVACIDDNTETPLTTKERAFIDEVYGDYAQKLFYSNEQRLKYVKQILRNRVTINYYENKDLSSLKPLSQVPLVDGMNQNLRRDVSYNKNTFNPLKYNFNFFSRQEQSSYYRIDNTQYLITISPSN